MSPSFRRALVPGLLLLAVWAGAVQAQTWSEQAPTGTPPLARYSASSGYDEASDRLILFSGEDETGLPRPQDVWVLADAAGVAGAPQWIELLPTGGPPLGRFGGTGVYDPGISSLIVHGGCSANCSPTLGDTWVLSEANGLGGTPEWTQLPDAPVARAQHAAVYDPASNRMIVFGGHTGFPGTDRDDVWVLVDANGSGVPEWQEVFPSGTPPAARSFPAAFYDPALDRLVLFGGETTLGGRFDDVWVLVGASGTGGAPQWVQLLPAGAVPPARSAHAMVYDALSNRATVFSGVDAAGLRLDDLWVLVGANGAAGTPQWIQLQPAGGPPPGRALPSAGYAPSLDRMVLTLGTALDEGGMNVFLDDVWHLANANGIVGGIADGLELRRVVCRNLTTGQVVSANLTATEWDCVELGLAVTPGDRVAMQVLGLAQ